MILGAAAATFGAAARSVEDFAIIAPLELSDHDARTAQVIFDGENFRAFSLEDNGWKLHAQGRVRTLESDRAHSRRRAGRRIRQARRVPHEEFFTGNGMESVWNSDQHSGASRSCGRAQAKRSRGCLLIASNRSRPIFFIPRCWTGACKPSSRFRNVPASVVGCLSGL